SRPADLQFDTRFERRQLHPTPAGQRSHEGSSSADPDRRSGRIEDLRVHRHARWTAHPCAAGGLHQVLRTGLRYQPANCLMNSPSEKLAAAIAERLVNEKLLSRAEAKKLLAKLANGKLLASDWRT